MTKREFKSGLKISDKDSCQTPQYALDPLYPFLKPDWVIWEPACGECGLVNALRSREYQVFASDIFNGQDFFKYQPSRFDMILTNPPFSCKLAWIARSYQLQKPFALLMPVELLGVGAAQKMFARYGIEVILLSKRIDFQTINTSFARSSSWFATAWMTWGLGIGQQITYGQIIKRPDAQLTMFREAA